MQRKILTLTEETPIRNLRTLIRKIHSETADEECNKVLAAITERKQSDPVILQLRCPERSPRDEVCGIRKIRFAMLGRVVAITIEANGPKTLDLIERYLVNGLPSTLLWLVSYRYNSSRETIR